MRYFLFSICLLAPLLSGCEMIRWASPHQLWKLNRQSGSRTDPYFSIPADPVEADGLPEERND
ncbi:MAG: hypothetical protein KDA80_18010 [Planctomycetaceae bacterium]|nr:hypothetical protein [Planctomycetaceae bacterium]